MEWTMKWLLAASLVMLFGAAVVSIAQDDKGKPATQPAAPSVAAPSAQQAPPPAPSAAKAAPDDSFAALFRQNIARDKAMELARKYLSGFLAGQTTEMWQHCTPELKKLFRSEERLTALPASLKQQLGDESKILNERVVPNIGNETYTRLSQYSAYPGNIVTTLMIDPEGNLSLFSISPAKNPAESSHLDYQDKTRLSLPFQGEWTVYQGGRSVYDNYHAEAADQRFAYDILVIKGDNHFAGNGRKNEDYYAFGQPILAPGAGMVALAVDEYDDNPPLKPSSTAPKYGNSVVIDHGNGEYSMLAHLKRGSVKVKKGDKVTAGQAIAECGNSGNSPIAHIHFHLQTTPDWFKGEGLPLQFKNISVNGKSMTSAEPVRGDVVSNP
jgi:murein DD-endopeptidase MepM/ murein hydrolase activator NlpD